MVKSGMPISKVIEKADGSRVSAIQFHIDNGIFNAYYPDSEVDFISINKHRTVIHFRNGKSIDLQEVEKEWN